VTIPACYLLLPLKHATSPQPCLSARLRAVLAAAGAGAALNNMQQLPPPPAASPTPAASRPDRLPPTPPSPATSAAAAAAGPPPPSAEAAAAAAAALLEGCPLAPSSAPYQAITAAVEVLLGAAIEEGHGAGAGGGAAAAAAGGGGRTALETAAKLLGNLVAAPQVGNRGVWDNWQGACDFVWGVC
jgi:hypothetical protein